MNNIFEDELMIFETTENMINTQLTRYIVACEESYIKNSYITEAEHKSLIVHLKEFFEKIISAMNNFKNAILSKFEKFKSENSLEIKLRNTKKKLIERKSQGETYIEYVNIFEYERVYLRMVDDLWKHAKKFSKVKYKDVNQLDRDLVIFNDKLDKYDSQLEKLEKNKVKIKIDDAITFLSREIGGNTQIIKTIEDCELKVREMDRDARTLEQKRSILGSDVIPKHVSVIKRVVNAITSFIRKKVSKFISIFVFLFAI